MTRDRLRFLCDRGVELALLGMLLVVPLVFYTQTHDVFETNKLAAFRLFTLLALLAYLTKMLLAGGEKIRISPLAYPVALVGLSSLLSTLWSNNRITSIFGVYEDYEGVLTIANYMLLWFLVDQHVRTLNDARKFLTAVIAAGSAAAAYGVAQNFGIDFVVWNPNTYTASRLFGSLGNPNFLAAYLLMALPVAVIRFWMSRRPSAKLLMLLAVLLMTVCIFFTRSRGAAYALGVEVVALAAYMIYDARRGGELWKVNRRWMLALGLLAVLSLGLPIVRAAITTTVTRTVATLNVKEIRITPRLYIWRSALQMIRDRPVLGSGLDTFQITFPKYRLPEYWRLEWNGTPEKAHNFFLQIGATTGLLGLAAWGWLIGLFFVLLLRKWRELPAGRRHLAASVGVAQIGFLVQNQFSFTVVAYGSLFWFLLALGPALDREEPRIKPGQRPEEPLAPAPADWMIYAGAAGLVLLVLVFSLRQWTADVFFKRGIILLSMGAPERAVPFLNQAAQLDSRREIYWVKLGIAFEEAAKRAPESQRRPLLQRAAEIHQHTIGMNPLNGYDFNNLGRVYKFWGDYLEPAKLAEAEQVCRRASESDPYNVYFALDLASIFLSERKLDEAAAVARKLTELFPDFAMPYSYLGYVALLQGNTEEAYRQLSAAAEKNWRGDVVTQSSTFSNLGIVRARRGELEGATAALRRSLELRPDYLEARLNLATILERRGRAPEALSEYRRIVEQAPQYPQADALRQKIAILERGKSSR